VVKSKCHGCYCVDQEADQEEEMMMVKLGPTKEEMEILGLEPYKCEANWTVGTYGKPEETPEPEMLLSDEAILMHMAQNVDCKWGKEYQYYAIEVLAKREETPDTVPQEETAEAGNAS